LGREGKGKGDRKGGREKEERGGREEGHSNPFSLLDIPNPPPPYITLFLVDSPLCDRFDGQDGEKNTAGLFILNFFGQIYHLSLIFLPPLLLVLQSERAGRKSVPFFFPLSSVFYVFLSDGAERGVSGEGSSRSGARASSPSFICPSDLSLALGEGERPGRGVRFVFIYLYIYIYI